MGHTSRKAGHWLPTLQIPGNNPPTPEKEHAMHVTFPTSAPADQDDALLAFEEIDVNEFDEERFEAPSPDRIMLQRDNPDSEEG